MPSDVFWFPAIWLAAAAGGFLRYLDRGPKVLFFGEWPGVKSFFLKIKTIEKFEISLSGY